MLVPAKRFDPRPAMIFEMYRHQKQTEVHKYADIFFIFQRYNKSLRKFPSWELFAKLI